jgi:hypothetical protein
MSPESTLPHIEQPVTAERDKLDLVKTIIISGPASSGKDSLERILRERYGWPVFESEDYNFERRGENKDQGPLEKDPSQHEDFDAKQARLFRNLKPEGVQKIHQTRLGGIILAQERDNRGREIGKKIRKNEWRAQNGKPPLPIPPQIPAISVLLWARKDVRIERAFQSQVNQWTVDAQQALAQGKAIPPKPEKGKIQADMEEKEATDVLIWAPIHKYVKAGENPFSRYLTRENGGPVYDRWIDTSDLTPEEVADKFVAIALGTGAARFHLKDGRTPDQEKELILGRETDVSQPPSL